VTSDQLLCATG